ncbi:hypothetical protein D3C71_1259190 [compost metagenome]
MSRPVGVITNVGDCGKAAVGIAVNTSIYNALDSSSFSLKMRIKIQYLLPLGHQIAHMTLLTGILLGNLKFDYLIRLRHST